MRPCIIAYRIAAEVLDGGESADVCLGVIACGCVSEKCIMHHNNMPLPHPPRSVMNPPRLIGAATGTAVGDGIVAFCEVFAFIAQG